MVWSRSGRASWSGLPSALAAIGSVVLLAFWAGTARSQAAGRGPASFLPDSNGTAEKFLRTAADHVRDGQWSEALQFYQRVIDQFGDKVARRPNDQPGSPGSDEFALYIDDRQLCHRAIARLPAEARAIYRQRIDGRAERWFREGASRRDLGLLRRVVDEAFCSAYGDDALELLGDLAFQDGRFGDALAAYRRLVADRADDASEVVHPDPSVDLVRVAAKKLLCRAAIGDDPPGTSEIDEFARRHPTASGTLAGRTGIYAQTIRVALASDHLAPPPQPDDRWPTFAGSARRSKVVPGPIDVGSIQWRVNLQKVTPNSAAAFGARANFAMGAPRETPERMLLAYHPIVLGDQVVVADGTKVLAYNLSDRPSDAEGSVSKPIEAAWKRDPDNASVPQAHRIQAGIPRYTLTAAGHRIYARMGTLSPPLFPNMNVPAATGSSSIIALDWNTQGKLLWERKSTDIVLPNRPLDRTHSRTVSFEGTPVADARSVFVALTDRGVQTATYVACFDAETGASRWMRYLGTASPDVNNQFMGGMPMQWGVTPQDDFHHRLLSLDGPALYYQTNMGAVVALEAETGATLWVATYPRHEANHAGTSSTRDLNPAVVHEGRVFVAPSDADSVFAFDAASGRLLWVSEIHSDEHQLAHVLGVARGHLVVTGNRVLLLDVKTGKLVHSWPDGYKKEGYGRGLLSGDLIFWPTEHEIQVLDQRTGLVAQPPIKLWENYHVRGGNLAAGDGYLIVAQSDELVVFCQNSRLIERYHDEIVRSPKHAPSYFRLARAAEAVGQDALALEMYEGASKWARPGEMIDGVLLDGTAKDHRFRLLLRLAGQARHARKWDAAADQLEGAARVARTDPDRLAARLLLADLFLAAGRPQAAVDICEQLLTDERIRPLAVEATDGHRTVRADLMITDLLTKIVHEHGRGAYLAYDQKAAELFERARIARDPRALDELCRTFPVALVIPDALVELGAIFEASGRPSDAAHAYKRLLLLAAGDERRALALWRLARVYESMKLVVAARDAYLDLQARFPSIHLEELDRNATVTELVAAELARAPYANLFADRPQPPTAVPMVRRWHLPAPAAQSLEVLTAVGVAPALDAGRMFLIDKTGLRLLDPLTGGVRWSSDLGARPVWAGYLADKLIAATPRQIIALDPAQGTVQWRFDLARPGKEPGRPDPFTSPKAVEPADARDRAAEPLSGFHLVKGRVFCLKGQHELLALDGDTGALDWSFSAASAEINANIWIGAERAVLQVNKPSQLLVLETDDGKLVTRASLPENDVLERPPFPIDDDSVLLVSDRRTVKKFDLSHGQTLWVYRESEDLPVNGPPRLLGDSERLLELHEGRSLIRLDAATGSKRWSVLLGMEDLSERPASMACDLKRFYCANQRTLRAISLDDGKALWSHDLEGPESAIWSITLTQHHVLAYPTKSGQNDPALIENMPLVVRRRETGELVQRFVFQTALADAMIKVDWRGALVATSRGVWGLASKGASQSPSTERTR
jgi:cellulose synthase operon protein C